MRLLRRSRGLYTGEEYVPCPQRVHRAAASGGPGGPVIAASTYRLHAQQAAEPVQLPSAEPSVHRASFA